MMKHRKGFTIVEILISLVIMGLLAGMAIPNFTNSMEMARAAEARSNLLIIYNAQRIFRLNNNGVYYAPAVAVNNAPFATINAALNMDIVGSFYNSINLTAGGVPPGAVWFQAVAIRGNPLNKRFTITQTGIITESGAYG